MFKSVAGRKNFMLQGGILAISGIIVRLIGMIYRIPMNNIIGSEGAGLYSAAFEIYNIALILSSYGMPMAVSKLVSARLATKEYTNTRYIFRRALIISLITGGIASLILFFGALGIEHVLYSGFPGMAIPLRFLAPTVFVVAILGTIRGFFQGQGTMIPTATSQLVEQIVNAVVSIVASYGFTKAYADSIYQDAHGASGGTFGTFMGALAALAVVVVLLIRNRHLYGQRLREDMGAQVMAPNETYKLIILTVVPIILGQTFYNLTSVLDGIFWNNIAKGWLDLSAIKAHYGNYGSTFSTLTSIPMGIASAMSASMLPSIVKSYTRGDKKSINAKIRKTVRATMIVAIPFVIALAVLGEPVIQLLFPRFNSVQGSIMLKIGSAAIAFYTLSTISGAALQGLDKMRIPVVHSMISLGIHIPLTIILLFTTRLGIYSIVIGIMQFSAVVFILNFRSLYRLNGYRQEIVGSFLAPLFCAAVMGIAILLLYRGLYAVIGHNLPVLIISGVVGVLIYFGMLTGVKKLRWY